MFGRVSMRSTSARRSHSSGALGIDTAESRRVRDIKEQTELRHLGYNMSGNPEWGYRG